jgi:hypothetical protein
MLDAAIVGKKVQRELIRIEQAFPTMPRLEWNERRLGGCHASNNPSTRSMPVL